MTTKTVTRYICDFCGKKGYSAGHMKNHEKHCTMNINRDCRMCDGSYTDLNAVVPEFEKRKPADHWDEYVRADVPTFLEPEESKRIIKDALDAAENCPACTLAILRISGLIMRLSERFDYEKEAKSYLDEKHSHDYEGVGW